MLLQFKKSCVLHTSSKLKNKKKHHPSITLTGNGQGQSNINKKKQLTEQLIAGSKTNTTTVLQSNRRYEKEPTGCGGIMNVVVPSRLAGVLEHEDVYITHTTLEQKGLGTSHPPPTVVIVSMLLYGSNTFQAASLCPSCIVFEVNAMPWQETRWRLS